LANMKHRGREEIAVAVLFSSVGVSAGIITIDGCFMSLVADGLLVCKSNLCYSASLSYCLLLLLLLFDIT
jgi:hypothetical protein